MATRTVRLDEGAEQLLKDIVQMTGLSISNALKEGLKALETDLREDSRSVPYAIYKELDLGPGGYAIAPSSDAKEAVKRVIAGKQTP